MDAKNLLCLLVIEANNPVTNLKKIIERYHLAIAVIILSAMFALGFGSMLGDSAIVDEVAHIPSGYSYLKYGDYRLNPEHPPLIKDISAFPLLFLDVKFPLDKPAWAKDVNGQWESGWSFIYHLGNNADQILLFSRLPILLLAVLLGFVIYEFSRRRYGPEVAVLALIFYAFSPNIIAHSRFVTTDLGIAAFTFFAFLGFFRFVGKPNKKNAAIFVVLFALAQLAKFSAIILAPFFGAMLLLKVIFDKQPDVWQQRAKQWFGKFILIGLAAFALVWLFYIPHTINMPEPVQDKLIQTSLPDGYYTRYGQYLVKLNDVAILRPMVQYVLGLLMVFNRVQSGNITYFLGEVTNQSFFWYFPVSFVMKTPIPFLILMLLAIDVAIWQYFQRKPTKVWDKLGEYTRNHFTELSFILFIAFYTYLSIKGNLNLGIRHLFPMMPMIYVLVAKKVIDFKGLLTKRRYQRIFAIALPLLAAWYALTAFVVYPKYLPYINSLFGGSGEAYRYLSDSNVDWGQDLKRLVSYVNSKPEIDKIAVDYFGGGSPAYYFCSRKFTPSGALIDDSSGYDCSKSKYIEWHAQDGVPQTSYIAVSETYLQNDRFSSKVRGDSGYQWLRDQTPIAKIGDSIYVFKIR